MNAIHPLRNTNQSTGAVYTRFPDVEKELQELYALSDAEVVQRCAIPHGSSGFVQTECVIHFLRHRLYTPKTFEPLFRILQRRARKLRLTEIDPDYTDQVRDGAFDRFYMLLATECAGYKKRLDYFEIDFSDAFSMLMVDELRQRTTYAAHFVEQSEKDDEDEEGVFEVGTDPEEIFRQLDFEQRWKVLQDCSTLRQRLAIKLMWAGKPIETSKLGQHSISSLLGVDPKTIHSDLKKAHKFFKALR